MIWSSEVSPCPTIVVRYSPVVVNVYYNLYQTSKFTTGEPIFRVRFTLQAGTGPFFFAQMVIFLLKTWNGHLATLFLRIIMSLASVVKLHATYLHRRLHGDARTQRVCRIAFNPLIHNRQPGLRWNFTRKIYGYHSAGFMLSITVRW